MRARTLTEWIDYYNSKTGNRFERDERYRLLYHPSRGFVELMPGKTMLIVGQMCGDGHFWKDMADALAASLGYQYVGAQGIRKSAWAYARCFGYRLDRVNDLGDGEKQYFGTHRATGKHIRVSPGFRQEDGSWSCFLTWEA